MPALINPLRTAAARRVPSDNSAVSVGPVPVGFQIAPARITLADVSVVRLAATVIGAALPQMPFAVT